MVLPSTLEFTVIVPTYCEKENVLPLVKLLEKALDGIAWTVIFVDDDSPDGTAAEVRRVASERSYVRLIQRTGARGLAGACIAGFRAATTPYVALMDADLQHDETILPEMLKRARENQADIVVGSRNIKGGSMRGGLSAIRAGGSSLVTALARLIPAVAISDPMSGFFVMRRECFEKVDRRLSHQGFKILLDILAAGKGKFKVEEVGYAMRSRQHGDSKLDASVTLELLALLISLALGGRLPVRFLLFGFVGATGAVLHLAIVETMARLGMGSFIAIQSTATMIAIASNFLLNNALTYRDQRLRGTAMLKGMVSFYGVCAFGAIANVGVATMIFEAWPHRIVAATVGIGVGALWNYAASGRVTWRRG